MSGSYFYPMTAWYMRFQCALLLLMSALLLAGSVGHGHVHHDEPMIRVDHPTGSLVKEQCALCDLLSLPAEHSGPTVRPGPMLTPALCALQGKGQVLVGLRERGTDRGPPALG